MGPTDFEVWPLDEHLSSRMRVVRAWHASAAADFYVQRHVDPENALDWLILGKRFPVFVREPLSGNVTQFLVNRSVNYVVSAPAVAAPAC